MKFKVVSFILAAFTLIGLGITLYTGVENPLSTVICILLYVLIPAYGAYGTWVQNRGAIFITLLFFISQSVRNVGNGSLIPHIAPITVSFPIGDFVNGEGYLIDFFAIFMAIYLAWLLREINSLKKDVEREC